MPALGHPSIKPLSGLRFLGKLSPAVVGLHRWLREQATHGVSSAPQPGSQASLRFVHLIQPLPCYHALKQRAEVIGVVERSAVPCLHSARWGLDAGGVSTWDVCHRGSEQLQ